MSLKPASSVTHDVNAKCFGLRIENQLLQLAIATPSSDGPYHVEIDEVACESPQGWLNAGGTSELAEAMKTLADRHDIRRGRVAMSLDGDFCVTRVATGSVDEIEKELSTLAVRVSRYLQLGPGEKVTGYCRTKLAPGVEYAVTGVVNRTLIQVVYNASRSADINVTWVEPSLVSIARLVGEANHGDDRPIMIADGTGKQWDLGIACSGRLLLDYRPAAAKSEESLRATLDGHISRLKRFCSRYRGVSTGELSRLMICGSAEKTSRAVSVLGGTLEIGAEVLRVPDLPHLYEIDPSLRESRYVPALSAVLPLLIGVPASDVPDMLFKIRRERDVPLVTRIIRAIWPVAAAVLLLCISFAMVSKQRGQLAATINERAELESQIEVTTVKFRELAEKKELLVHLKRIESLTQQPNFDDLLGQITQSLPDTAKLNGFLVEPNGHVLLDGTVLEEEMVYELVSNFRQLPGVSEVALTGTAPDESVRGTRFTVRLITLGAQAEERTTDE